MIQIRISDSRSLGSWCIKGTDESTLVMDSSVPLMQYDPCDLGSLILIQIIPKECALRFFSLFQGKSSLKRRIYAGNLKKLVDLCFIL